MNLTPYYDFAVRTAQHAGKILLDHYRTDLKINYKSSNKKNLVTMVDKKSEKFIVDAIKSKFPDHSVLAEEGGEYEPQLARTKTAGLQSTLAKSKNAAPHSFRWIIDPLDGTTNYAHGHNFFAVSIALEIDGEIVIGVVYAPQLDELFRAAKGHKAYLNNETIHVSKIKKLDDSLLATGWVYEQRDRNMPFVKKFMGECHGLRRCGAAAIDLAYLAMGRYDGFWEFGLKAWDIAAGNLIVEEAGGKITDMAGKKINIDDFWNSKKSGKTSTPPTILATNSLIHGQMLKMIRSV